VSNAALTISGLTELREALKKLPPELVRDAAVLVDAEANEAARQITAGYPTGPTGNLKAHVVVEIATDAVSARARVKSTAKHAHIFEYGTAARRWANGKSTGRMPVGGVFVPIVIARRRVLVAALIELVERAGLKVTAA